MCVNIRFSLFIANGELLWIPELHDSALCRWCRVTKIASNHLSESNNCPVIWPSLHAVTPTWHLYHFPHHCNISPPPQKKVDLFESQTLVLEKCTTFMPGACMDGGTHSLNARVCICRNWSWWQTNGLTAMEHAWNYTQCIPLPCWVTDFLSRSSMQMPACQFTSIDPKQGQHSGSKVGKASLWLVLRRISFQVVFGITVIARNSDERAFGILGINIVE